MEEIAYRPEVIQVANLVLKVPYPVVVVVVTELVVLSIPKFHHQDTDLTNLHWLNGGHYLEVIISLLNRISSLVITE